MRSDIGYLSLEVNQSQTIILLMFFPPDEVIRKRLLIDGDGAGDDRRINLLVKSFIKWCNSGSQEDGYFISLLFLHQCPDVIFHHIESYYYFKFSLTLNVQWSQLLLNQSRFFWPSHLFKGFLYIY